jgi:hypothetical protein
VTDKKLEHLFPSNYLIAEGNFKGAKITNAGRIA